MRPRTSPIWTSLDDDKFEELVSKSKSYKEILAFFGFENKGSNHRTLKKRIEELKIDCSHLRQRHDSMVLLNIDKKIPLEEILVENSSYNRGHLKKRLLKEKVLENRCVICGLSKWNGKSLVLILDHENGIPDDNRLEYLRLVCPNCNSQLETHCGRKKEYFCECGESITKNAKVCPKCRGLGTRKVCRPSVEILSNEVKRFGYSAVARKYGVSDNAVRKWLNKINGPVCLGSNPGESAK